MGGFIKKHKKGPTDKTVYVAEGEGFFRLVYDHDGLVVQAAYVRKRGSQPRSDQLQLWFIWVNDMVTFKTESSLGGWSWSGGAPVYGTTLELDDDGPSARPARNKLISFDAWVDDCVKKMIEEP